MEISERIQEWIREFMLLYKVELVFIGISFALVVVSGSLLLAIPKEIKAQNIPIKGSVARQESVEEIFMYVDISGAIEYPDVYKIKQGTRLHELIEKAGGFSDLVDRAQVEQTMNLSKVLADQEKLYIPKIGDNSTFDGIPDGGVGMTSLEMSLIDINKASSSELDSVPGIGPVTAQKIIDGRPYTTVTELVSNKILGKALYERLKDSFIVE